MKLLLCALLLSFFPLLPVARLSNPFRASRTNTLCQTHTHAKRCLHLLARCPRKGVYVCVRAGACVEWRLLLLLSEPFSFLPPCLLARVHCSLKNLSSFDSKAPQVTLTCTWWEKNNNNKKTMWSITVLVEEDAGVVYRQCSGSYLPQNTLLFLIRQQIWWKWRLWGSRKTEFYLGGWRIN